jgi:hypothetical protein
MREIMIIRGEINPGFLKLLSREDLYTPNIEYFS